MLQKNERVSDDLSFPLTKSLPSSRATWALNWHLLRDEGNADPSQIFKILDSQTFNDRELFQAVVRRDWEATLRLTKRLKIKLSPIYAISTIKRASELEDMLLQFQKESEGFSKTKLYRYRENLLPQENELAKKFIELVKDLRDVIIEIEDFTDEPFNAGNCTHYVEEVERAFFTEDAEQPKKDTACSRCGIF